LWQNLKSELKDVAIVRPSKLIQADGDPDLLNREQQDERQTRLASSHGLVLLHSGRDSWLERAVANNYFHRRLLWQRERLLPWAILNNVGERPQVADDYGVPCVPTTSNEWRYDLLTVLGLVSPSLGATP
jgi:hypothetical protein